MASSNLWLALFLLLMGGYYFGVIPQNAKLTEWPDKLLKRWEALTDDEKKLFLKQVDVFAAFVAWAWFGPEPRLASGLVAAVSVLIIACPCALGLMMKSTMDGSMPSTRPLQDKLKTRFGSRPSCAPSPPRAKAFLKLLRQLKNTVFILNPLASASAAIANDWSSS